MDALVVGELSFQVPRKICIQLEEEELRARAKPAEDLSRMHSLAGSVLRDHSWLSEIHLAGDPLHKCLGTGNNGSDLEGSLQKSLEKQNAHRRSQQSPAAPALSSYHVRPWGPNRYRIFAPSQAVACHF